MLDYTAPKDDVISLVRDVIDEFYIQHAKFIIPDFMAINSASISRFKRGLYGALKSSNVEQNSEFCVIVEKCSQVHCNVVNENDINIPKSKLSLFEQLGKLVDDFETGFDDFIDNPNVDFDACDFMATKLTLRYINNIAYRAGHHH